MSARYAMRRQVIAARVKKPFDPRPVERPTSTSQRNEFYFTDGFISETATPGEHAGHADSTRRTRAWSRILAVLVAMLLVGLPISRVSAHYQTIPAAIPIPATFSLALGAVIDENQGNIACRFVSALPFRGRAPHVLDVRTRCLADVSQRLHEFATLRRLWARPRQSSPTRRTRLHGPDLRRMP